MPATKDEIAAKFMELAFRYGFKRTAVEDVARELHISKKTIYEHFASKDELLRYAIELGLAGAARARRVAADRDDGAGARPRGHRHRTGRHAAPSTSRGRTRR